MTCSSSTTSTRTGCWITSSLASVAAAHQDSIRAAWRTLKEPWRSAPGPSARLRRMVIRTSLAAAAVLLAAAACGSSLSAPRVAGSTSRAAAVSSPAPVTGAQRTHAWLAFAACMRAHGANLPDPSFDRNGNPQWSVNPKTLPQAAVMACQADLQAVSGGSSDQAPTAAELAQLTRFAQCVRQHGLPNFPDPNPQTGSFDGVDKTSPALRTAAQACQQYGFKK